MTDRKLFAVRLLLAWSLLEVMAAAQVRTPAGELVLGRWVDIVARPVEWIASQSAGAGRAVVAQVSSRHRLARENRRLYRELELELAANQLLRGEIATLRETLAALPMTDGFDLRPMVGRCVYRDLSGGRVEVQTPGPVALDTPVVGAGGIIGRVVLNRGRMAWIELITHPAAAVAVQTADGQIQAIAAGTGGETLEVHYVPRSAPLVVNTVLQTSGADGVFPMGLPVATVSHVRERDAAFLEVRAHPTAAVEASRVVLLLTPETSERGREAVR